MTAVLKINEELNGIELYFESKPKQEVLTNLKSNGFRWSGYKKCWYTKQSEKAFEVAQNITNNIDPLHIAPTKEKAPATKKRVKKESFNLWNATQWNGLNIPMETKEKEAKEIAKELRSHVRKQFPGCKFSIRVPYYGRISFSIKATPYEKGSVYLESIKEYCVNLLNAHKHTYQESDPYTDYAGVYNFTGWVEIDWEYAQLEQAEEIKKDMLVFDSKLAEFEKAEEERKELEFQAYLEEQKKRDEEYKQRQEVEKKQKEHIYNSIETNELDEKEQYFINGAEFADLNKNNTLDEYKEEIQKGKFSLETVKITKEIHFNNLEALTDFSNMLLHDFSFLEGTGGSYTDDNRINSMTDYYNMDDIEKESVKWNLYGVAIYFNGKLQFVVDAQGYSYARYVGLTDNATIENSFNYEQIKDNEEITELKKQAQTLEDISTSVIEELNIFSTWNNENWKEYKEAFKSKLKQYNIKLTKDIIQQLEIEELKIHLYKILVEVDGIQEQFENAVIEKGEKVTLFYISDWGSIVTHRITFDSFTPSTYAQYDNAVKLTFTPERKRNLHYKYFYSTLLVYKGFHTLPDEVLYNIGESNGFITKSSKYSSTDKRQYDEILSYFEQQGIKPVINTYKPTF